MFIKRIYTLIATEIVKKVILRFFSFLYRIYVHCKTLKQNKYVLF